MQTTAVESPWGGMFKTPSLVLMQNMASLLQWDAEPLVGFKEVEWIPEALSLLQGFSSSYSLVLPFKSKKCKKRE